MKLSKRYGSNFGIYFAEDEDPLNWATFGAFTSRNNGSFESLLQKVTSSSKKRIIEETFIGYGHESIGDMVDIKMFLEGIPIWFAFELEGFSRFRGQESSTRYIDFSNQVLMPYYSDYQEWYDEKIKDYVNAFNIVHKNLLETIPGDVSELGRIEGLGLHIKATKARAFDICRGLIPTICTTNMVWFGSIREIRQHLASLTNLPFVEEIVNALNEQYPETKPIKEIRTRRPWSAGDLGTCAINGILDFGSYRDLRRHRVGTHSHDVFYYDIIDPWYTYMLEQHGIKVKNPLEYGEEKSINLPPFIPLLGTPVSVWYNCDMDQARYVARLRSKPNVHPTLRIFIQKWKDDLYVKDCVNIDPDVGAFGYYLVRGQETIEFKNTG